MYHKKLNILLVDDDNEELGLFYEALSYLAFPKDLYYRDGYTTDIFQLLEEKNINIIFLDINMPGKSGFHLLEDLKGNPQYRSIPVVMYSASVRDEDMERAYKLSAHYYLVKPYALHNFIESMRTIFKRDWTKSQPLNSFDHFLVNLAFA